jgi:hypothetical protein
MFDRRRNRETRALLCDVRERLDATDELIQRMLAAQTSEVRAELDRSAAMNEVLARLVDDDRVERRALVAAVLQLPLRADSPEPTRGRRRREPAPAATDEREVVLDADLDLLAGPAFDRGTAVACRFGDQWIKGVEIADVLDDPVETTYRIRRRRDGYMLPAVFRACDLSLVLEPAKDEPHDEPNPRRREVMTRRPDED